MNPQMKMQITYALLDCTDRTTPKPQDVVIALAIQLLRDKYNWTANTPQTMNLNTTTMLRRVYPLIVDTLRDPQRFTTKVGKGGGILRK